MKAACSTLPAAITRARSDGADHACTAAKDGTTNRPPPNANRKKSASMRMPAKDAVKAAAVTSVPCTVLPMAQERSRPTMPITMAPIGTSARFGRTWLSCAANSEPAAMPIANTARQTVTTPSVPPMPPLTSAGSSDSTIAPTIQNHDTITMPSHRRGSA